MALSDKITKAVKDAQKQAETTAADMRGQLDEIEGRLPDVTVDPTPFYAVVGAADIALETVRAAREQLDQARKQAQAIDVREGAKQEANQLQKDVQKRIDDLQKSTAALQKLVTSYADKFVAQAQDLPAQVSTRASSSRATPRTSTTPPPRAARRSSRTCVRRVSVLPSTSSRRARLP